MDCSDISEAGLLIILMRKPCAEDSRDNWRLPGVMFRSFVWDPGSEGSGLRWLDLAMAKAILCMKAPMGESRVFIANLLDCVGRASQRPAFCYVNLHRGEHTEWEDLPLPMDKTVDFDSWDKDKHCGDRMDVTALLANRI